MQVLACLEHVLPKLTHRLNATKLVLVPLLQIFPHHENEIAQSQACACDHDRQQMDNNGTDFVRFWLHNGFVNGTLADCETSETLQVSAHPCIAHLPADPLLAPLLSPLMFLLHPLSLLYVSQYCVPSHWLHRGLVACCFFAVNTAYANCFVQQDTYGICQLFCAARYMNSSIYLIIRVQ